MKPIRMCPICNSPQQYEDIACVKEDHYFAFSGDYFSWTIGEVRYYMNQDDSISRLRRYSIDMMAITLFIQLSYRMFDFTNNDYTRDTILQRIKTLMVFQ